MFHYKNIISDLIFVLVLFSHLQGSLSAECKNNNNFTFGTYQSGDKTITRSCTWLTKDPQRAESRKKFWCSRKYINKRIQNVCPEACDTCDDAIILGTCSNLSPSDDNPSYPKKWLDSFGYDCAWYTRGDNCIIFGSGFSNFGYTAKQACCACGGGVIKDQRRVLDEVSPVKQLRGASDKKILEQTQEIVDERHNDETE